MKKTDNTYLTLIALIGSLPIIAIILTFIVICFEASALILGGLGVLSLIGYVCVTTAYIIS